MRGAQAALQEAQARGFPCRSVNVCRQAKRRSKAVGACRLIDTSGRDPSMHAARSKPSLASGKPAQPGLTAETNPETNAPASRPLQKSAAPTYAWWLGDEREPR